MELLLEYCFKRFSELKKHLGPAGEGYAWHHIVEQTRGNLIKFGPEAIHNTGNVIRLPHGKGQIHMKLSGFYSSKDPVAAGQTVRQWLNAKDYQMQYDFGVKQLNRLGAKK